MRVDGETEETEETEETKPNDKRKEPREEILERLVKLQKEKNKLMEKKRDCKKKLRSRMDDVKRFKRLLLFAQIDYRKRFITYSNNNDETEGGKKAREYEEEGNYVYYKEKTDWNIRLANEDKANIKQQDERIKEVHNEVLLCVKQLKELN